MEKSYLLIAPKNYDLWLKEQEAFWNSTNKKITRSFFEVLKDCKWKCVRCKLPNNPNWARRFQDIKEFGYTTATNTRKFCNECKKNTTQLLLLPIEIGHGGGYETWSNYLRNRIINVFGKIDSYEGKIGHSLLPDHKFPEIRWDENTLVNNSDNMSNDEIKEKFQLLSNQRNQQKREVCRNCYQSGKRGCPYGIKFFYEGNENWPSNVPKKGKSAEQGCIGCGWYDLKKWKDNLNKKVSGKS